MQRFFRQISEETSVTHTNCSVMIMDIVWMFQCSWYDYTGLNQQYCWENKHKREKEWYHLLKRASCVHSAHHQFASSGVAQHNSFLWLRRGLTQVKEPGNILLLRKCSVPFALCDRQASMNIYFFPIASLHNQCMPWILIWDENSLRKREMESLPAHIHYMCSGASGKYLRLPGMSWKKLCLHYFLILVPKHRELKVSILGQPWRNLLFWKVRWQYVLQKFLWRSFMCFSQCLHILINTSDYLPACWCLPFSSVV